MSSGGEQKECQVKITTHQIKKHYDHVVRHGGTAAAALYHLLTQNLAAKIFDAGRQEIKKEGEIERRKAVASFCGKTYLFVIASTPRCLTVVTFFPFPSDVADVDLGCLPEVRTMWL